MEEYKTQFVLNLLAYAVQRDISPVHLCQLSGIDFTALQNRSADPITEKQLNDLWLNAIHLSDDAAFGLHFAESLQLSALGAVGQIIQASRTVGEALVLAAESLKLVTDKVAMEVSRTKASVVVKFFCTASDRKGNSMLSQQLLEFFMVFTVHEMDGLILKKIKPITVRCDIRAPVGIHEYERVFRCKPSLKKDESIMEFEPMLWDVPIITANYRLQRHLLEMGNKNVQGRGETLMRDRIVNYLMTNAYLGVATLEEIASNFNITSRTLQRKLQEEGVSFQQLADSVRKTLALNYLKSGNYPLKEISYILGYNELSAFTRAFKRWTGFTPIDYRRRKDEIN